MYYADPSGLILWLNEFQLQYLSKNTVRKDMWDTFVQLVHFDRREGDLLIPTRIFLRLQSFANADGRGLTDDALMSVVTALNSLRQLVTPVSVQEEHKANTTE